MNIGTHHSRCQTPPTDGTGGGRSLARETIADQNSGGDCGIRGWACKISHYRCPVATERLSSQGQAKFSGDRRLAATARSPLALSYLTMHL